LLFITFFKRAAKLQILYLESKFSFKNLFLLLLFSIFLSLFEVLLRMEKVLTMVETF